MLNTVCNCTVPIVALGITMGLNNGVWENVCCGVRGPALTAPAPFPLPSDFGEGKGKLARARCKG